MNVQYQAKCLGKKPSFKLDRRKNGQILVSLGLYAYGRPSQHKLDQPKGRLDPRQHIHLGGAL